MNLNLNFLQSIMIAVKKTPDQKFYFPLKKKKIKVLKLQQNNKEIATGQKKKNVLFIHIPVFW